MLVGYSMKSKAYRVYTKRSKIIEESIHVLFDESNDGRQSSSSFQELKLSTYDDEKEEEKRPKTSKEHKEQPQDSNIENNVPPISEEPNVMNKE